MGLIKGITTPQGATPEYWSITSETIDRLRARATITLDCWATKNAKKQAGLAPFDQMRKTVILEGADFIDPAQPLANGKNRVELLYEKVTAPKPGNISTPGNPPEIVETNFFADAQNDELLG